MRIAILGAGNVGGELGAARAAEMVRVWLALTRHDGRPIAFAISDR